MVSNQHSTALEGDTKDGHQPKLLVRSLLRCLECLSSSFVRVAPRRRQRQGGSGSVSWCIDGVLPEKWPVELPYLLYIRGWNTAQIIRGSQWVIIRIPTVYTNQDSMIHVIRFLFCRCSPVWKRQDMVRILLSLGFWIQNPMFFPPIFPRDWHMWSKDMQSMNWWTYFGIWRIIPGLVSVSNHGDRKSRP